MDQSTLYRDIAGRCEGDIYLGVVGPVRTGKSTFIKRFMELLVLPNLTGEHRRERAQDEMPQSGAGRTIMTTQPKFVPNEAVEIQLRDEASFRVRLVDCVGYLIDGVLGLDEDGQTRMVPVAVPATATVDRVLEMAPQLIDRVEGFVNKKKEEKEFV